MTPARPAIRIAWRDLFVDRARTALVVGLLAIAAIWLTLIAGRPGMGGTGFLLFMVAVLVQISALAIGDRDRLQVVGLLDVNGAGRRVQRMVVLAQAMILGTSGAVSGLLVGAVLRLAWPETSDALRFGDVILVLALGIGASVAAAVISGLRGNRVPTRAALAGRRPSVTPRYWRLGVSVMLVGLGANFAGSTDSWTGMLVSVPIGGLLVGGGGVGIALFIASRVPRLTRSLGGVVGHAGKGLARQRYRTGPLLALMTVTIGFCMVGAVMGRSFKEREDLRVAFHHRVVARTIAPTILPANVVRVDDSVEPQPFDASKPAADKVSLAQALHRALPTAAILPLNGARRYGEVVEVSLAHLDGADEPDIPRLVVIGDARLLDALGVKGHAADLAAGRAVALTPFAIDHGRVTVQGRTGWTAQVPGVWAKNRSTRAWPSVVISPATAQRLGLVRSRVGTLLRAPRPIDSRQAAALHRAIGASFGLTVSLTSRESDDVLSLLVASPAIGGRPTDTSKYGKGGLFASDHSGDLADGPFINTDERGLRSLVIAGAALALAAVVIALTLASLDRRRDDELFAVLGAPQRFRRRLGATQAGMLAIIASGVGTALGLAAPAYAFWLYNSHARGTLPPIPFVLPVEAVLVLLVAVPAVAVAATWALTPANAKVQMRAFDG